MYNGIRIKSGLGSSRVVREGTGEGLISKGSRAGLVTRAEEEARRAGMTPDDPEVAVREVR